MKKPKFPAIASEMAKRGEILSDLAKLLDVSPLTIFNKLNGKTEFTVSEVEKLKEHYGKSYDELFG